MAQEPFKHHGGDYLIAEHAERGEMGLRLPFPRYHNPLGRHVVLRHRATLEKAGLMDRIDVSLHPRDGSNPAIFEGSAVRTPGFYDDAYEEVQRFTRAMRARGSSASRSSVSKNLEGSMRRRQTP